jgi:hypothetical protein
MTRPRPPVVPPIIRSPVPVWILARDILLTIGAWLVIVFSLREALYLVYDYFRAPIFQLTTASAPDWVGIWQRLRGFILLACGLVSWIAFWAFDQRARLRATSSPQPAPLDDGSLAASTGLTPADLPPWRSAKVQTVDLDLTRKILSRTDGRPKTDRKLGPAESHSGSNTQVL